MGQENKAFNRFFRMDEMGLTEDMAGWQHLARLVPVMDEWDGQLSTCMEIMRGGKSVKQTEDAIWRAMEMARKKRPTEWEDAPWAEGTKRMLYWLKDRTDGFQSVESFLRSLQQGVEVGEGDD